MTSKQDSFELPPEEQAAAEKRHHRWKDDGDSGWVRCEVCDCVDDGFCPDWTGCPGRKMRWRRSNTPFYGPTLLGELNEEN